LNKHILQKEKSILKQIKYHKIQAVEKLLNEAKQLQKQSIVMMT